MRVLVACEFSGRVRDAFRQCGHTAVSADILPSETPGEHYQGDVRDIMSDGWDLMIAHPPCTYLANSGVSWLYKDESRWNKLDSAASFFLELWNAPIKKICIENPIMHKHGRERIGNLQYTQIIQPWQFGHPESKATCLWLKNLPALHPTNNVKDEMEALPKNQRHRMHFLPPSETRWMERSRTYQGIADAMAKQWGNVHTPITRQAVLV